ncbi:hypothetical protein RhiXN_09489 [Rhizoctonia solani]|uniref:Uncharacterized protein n=1 Tax=Rhizoctonia solani TaxID=456999 RepID=A0A8H8P1D0_9AGAM|nr:uncharacterized protein RhiXN_09489 [Rhizoctonia solani]QRW21902.1 hypothetical protein RhiXN_09489 [Rhizoctonia solani]
MGFFMRDGKYVYPEYNVCTSKWWKGVVAYGYTAALTGNFKYLVWSGEIDVDYEEKHIEVVAIHNIIGLQKEANKHWRDGLEEILWLETKAGYSYALMEPEEWYDHTKWEAVICSWQNLPSGLSQADPTFTRLSPEDQRPTWFSDAEGLKAWKFLVDSHKKDIAGAKKGAGEAKEAKIKSKDAIDASDMPRLSSGTSRSPSRSSTVAGSKRKRNPSLGTREGLRSRRTRLSYAENSEGSEKNSEDTEEDSGKDGEGSLDRQAASPRNSDSHHPGSKGFDPKVSSSEGSGSEDSGSGSEDSGSEDSGSKDSGSEDSGSEDSGSEDSEDSGSQSSSSDDVTVRIVPSAKNVSTESKGKSQSSPSPIVIDSSDCDMEIAPNNTPQDKQKVGCTENENKDKPLDAGKDIHGSINISSDTLVVRSSSSPRRAVASSPRRAVASSPLRAVASSSRRAMTSSPRHAVTSSRRAVAPSNPRSVVVPDGSDAKMITAGQSSVALDATRAAVSTTSKVAGNSPSTAPDPDEDEFDLDNQRRGKCSWFSCRKAPRTARCTAETDNTLLDVDELVSASFKQVQFANEDVVEYMAEINASGIEDSYEGNGDGAGSGLKEGTKMPMDDEMAGNRKTTKRWGRASGSNIYSKPQEQIIIGGVKNYRPSQEAPTTGSVSKISTIMAKRRKPTNNGEGSKIHDAVLQLEAERLAQEETVDLDDGEWLDSDKALEPCMKSESDAIVTPLPLLLFVPNPIMKTQLPFQSFVPAKRKASLSATAKESVMAELGITYYAAKAVQLSKVESTAGRCWDVQTTLDHICATLWPQLHNRTTQEGVDQRQGVMPPTGAPGRQRCYDHVDLQDRYP